MIIESILFFKHTFNIQFNIFLFMDYLLKIP